MVKVFVTLFQYFDQTITYTNREQAKAVIWSDIDDEDIKILVSVVIDGGKRSRIVATAVRQVNRSYNLLRVGIITGPRFVETFQFYASHGGFTVPMNFGGKRTGGAKLASTTE